MTDRSQHDRRWMSVGIAILITSSFAILLIWFAQSHSRTVAFAFSVNWILTAWAISLGRVLQSRAGAWDGLSVWLPASYYTTRSFEMADAFMTTSGSGGIDDYFVP